MTNRELLDRYDSFFGKGVSNKLIESVRLYSKNQFIRINLSKVSIKEIEDFLIKNRVKFSKTFFLNAFKIEKSFFNITSSIEAISGKIYMQDLASQIPINTIDFESLKTMKKIRVLDMAASPGSKTTQIVDLLNYHKIDYEIVALEPEEKRLTKLINNIQKQDFENIKIINCLGEEFNDEKKFDIILLDAPCSGNLVGDSNWLNKRDINGIEKNSALQKKLLKNGAKLLNENGILIYSTCSLEVEENELNVDWILKSSKLKTFRPKINFGFNTKPLSIVREKQLDDGVKNCIRIMPYESKTQGFFVCCFKN